MQDDSSDLSRWLLRGLEPGRARILALIINIASYRDMCSSCQNTFLQELTYGHLFLNHWRDRLKTGGIAEEVPVVVAQSGVEEYSGEAVKTRSAESGFVAFDMSRTRNYCL